MGDFTSASAYLGSVVVNPANNAVLATTGAITADEGYTGTNVEITYNITSTAAATVKLQIWNGSAEVAALHIAVLANLSQMVSIPIPIQLVSGYHVRLLMTQALTGSIQGAIFLGTINLYT